MSHEPPRFCLLTGATSGIGRASALELARLGYRMVLVGRDRRRGEVVVREVRRATGGEGPELLVGDLSSGRGVRRVAEEFLGRHGRLHVLVNNAGVITRRRSVTEDGLETQFAVNHLAPFLLTRLLLDALRSSAPARVVTVSSEAHRRGEIDFDDLQGERRYSPLEAYAQSKLANVLFTLELARRLEGTGVTANALHPGAIATKLLYAAFPPIRLVRPFLKGPREGARTVVYVSTAPELEGVTGRYFRDRRPVEPSAPARDPALARRLWRRSEELAGLR